MKLQIVETDDYVLAVSDVKPTVGNQFIYEPITQTINTTCNGYTPNEFDFIIKAYKPKNNALELDLPLLPEIVVEDDIERLAKEYSENKSSSDVFKEQHKVDFIAGYKSATKVYSEEDLRNIIIELASECLCIDGEISSPAQAFKWIEKKIQSLKQPKPKWFVAEIEEWLDQTYSEYGCYKQKLKTITINNKTYLVGTYLFE